ncbi:MAG TPA: hypothetical protein VGX75_13255 [bacterium]|nr:hypothetical protein [bacterium]
MSEYVITVGVVAAGVVLPKVIPIPALRNDPPAPVRRWFACIVPAIFGALTIPMVGRLAASVPATAWESAVYVAAYVAIGVMAAMVRRTSLAFGIGVLTLAALQLAKL